MHLVKWFRKNNKKVMAIVVIVIMIGFVGGSYISRLGRRGRTGLHKTMAHFADGRKITNYDRQLARRELEILKMLRADVLLRSISVPPFRTPDLRAILLGELLFSERGTSPELINYMKRIIRLNGYRISNKQINDIYKRSASSDIYWLLLKSEAQLAGFRLSNTESGSLLARVIPQLFEGTTYSQLIGSIINRRGIPENEILTTFSELTAVLEYAKMACSSEDVTARQIMQTVSFENETVDVELVKFDSAVFAESRPEPMQQEISEHFDKYKKFFAGTVSDQNPYGFGYKLPDRVRLQYIAVKLDDASGIVTPPTAEQTEEYYRKNRERYVEQIPSDPNDPNSPLIERTKSYAEVAGIISDSLLQNKITSKANRILQEAKTLTEVGFENDGRQTAENRRQMTDGYETAADELSKKYKIKIYAGQTGLLSAADIGRDEQLKSLYLKGYGRNNPVGLAQIVFAVDELKASELGLFDVSKPRMYENIGPFEDMLGKIMVLVRIIRAEKAAEPQSADQSYSRETIRFETGEEQTTQNIYSVKERVAEDLKKLAAMDTTKGKAKEFIKQVVKDGWEDAVKKFKELYGRQGKLDERDPNVFELRNLTNLRRMSRETLAALAAQSSGEPAARFLGNEREKRSRFIGKLYSLLPQGKDVLDTVPLIMEFKPDMSFYCLKSLSVRHLDQNEYEKIKAGQVYKEDIVQSQSMAIVHFDPENILKRLNYRPIVKSEETADTNAPAESGGTS